ncbi:MAG TPA: BON domain-containing protein [Polyangiaceae bacterium]|nr:BON domain-containing protein [Polyangiaceae bacterium]
MPRDRYDWWVEEMDRASGGARGLEPDFGGVGTSPNYRGGSWVDQRGTSRARGPYVGVGPKGYRRSDQAIYEDVCERLMRFGYVDASDLEVSVEGGEVTLTGWVDDRDQKRLAEDLSDGVAGVHDVHNRIRIRHQPGTGVPELAREARASDES